MWNQHNVSAPTQVFPVEPADLVWRSGWNYPTERWKEAAVDEKV